MSESEPEVEAEMLGVEHSCSGFASNNDAACRRQHTFTLRQTASISPILDVEGTQLSSPQWRSSALPHDDIEGDADHQHRHLRRISL